MKRFLKRLLIIIVTFLFYCEANAQEIKRNYPDAHAEVNLNDTVILHLNDYTGETFQWQQSFDLQDWTEISNANSDTFLFKADTTKYLRAKVIAGDCDPFYSDTILVYVHMIGQGEGVTDINGNYYPSIIIGNQEWMAKNLRVANYTSGDSIPTGFNNDEWIDLDLGAFTIYDHNKIEADGINSPEEMVTAYGKLYNWFAVDDERGICPIGWHVPSNDEWTHLEQFVCNFLGNSDCEDEFPILDFYFPGPRGTNESYALRSCRQINSPLGGECNTTEHPRWREHHVHFGTDELGFSILPSGVFAHSWNFSGFSGLDQRVVFWTSTNTSTAGNADRSFVRTFLHMEGSINLGSSYNVSGNSVRCVKD